MKKEFWIGMAAGVISAAIVGCAGYLGYHRGMSEQENVLSDPAHLAKLLSIENMIDEYYLNEKDEERLAEGMYAGLVYGLEDPYSRYYTAEEYSQESSNSQGTYVGIGAVMQKEEDGTIQIVECYEGGSGEQAGLEAGDLLLEIDGQDVRELELQEVVNQIRQDGRESVLFRIRRGEQEPFEVTIPISDVEIPSVHHELLEDRIGYLKIDEFKGVTYDQFTEAYEALEQEGMEKLIVDLRNNPGGYLDTVCNILREILPEGLIVYSEDKYGNREEETCDGKNEISIPMAVLVNGNSASASEIFAGAVKDYGIGTIVGTTTFGKGIVQSIRTFKDGSALKLTVSHYYTPKGNDIHGVGIQPDVYAEEDAEGTEDAPLRAAIEALKK